VIARALISVYDKGGLITFAQGLVELGVEIVATGGTAAYLEEHGLPTTRVEKLTGFAELLGHRVVTLHPAVHGGILARRDVPEDVADLQTHGIDPFDLVCVNLYPFQDAAGRHGTREEDAVEMIDIGGPSLLRGAAKNFAYVAPVCRPDQYEPLLEELRRDGSISVETRRRLASEAFAATAAYEAAIASWFSERDAFPDALTLSFTKELDLAYGENPHQRAAYYSETGARRHLLSCVEKLHGKELSFNNLNDLSAARLLLEEFTVPACVIVKHANPCGAALGTTAAEAYERALAADPVSAYGGVVALNRHVDADLGGRLSEQFVEVLIAPGYEPAALETLGRKPSTRILQHTERREASPGERDFRRVIGGLLVQDRDRDIEGRETMRVVCGQLDEAGWGDLLFAWRVCKHVASNAIVIAKRLQTLGIGAGQMNRLDAVTIAVEKARELGHDLRGAVVASDAFFPFPDAAVRAVEHGVQAIVQPGGARRDGDVIAAVEAGNAAMVFTGRRHFRH
jgi:phosphoribosylaminoimidazolecarboxamide formyltransferase/IMP cyclohydrolase